MDCGQHRSEKTAGEVEASALTFVAHDGGGGRSAELRWINFPPQAVERLGLLMDFVYQKWPGPKTQTRSIPDHSRDF